VSAILTSLVTFFTSGLLCCPSPVLGVNGALLVVEVVVEVVVVVLLPLFLDERSPLSDPKRPLDLLLDDEDEDEDEDEDDE